MVCPCDVLLVVENQNTLYKHETPTWNNLELDLFQAKFVSRKIRIFFSLSSYLLYYWTIMALLLFAIVGAIAFELMFTLSCWSFYSCTNSKKKKRTKKKERTRVFRHFVVTRLVSTQVNFQDSTCGLAFSIHDLMMKPRQPVIRARNLVYV